MEQEAAVAEEEELLADVRIMALVVLADVTNWRSMTGWRIWSQRMDKLLTI